MNLFNNYPACTSHMNEMNKFTLIGTRHHNSIFNDMHEWQKANLYGINFGMVIIKFSQMLVYLSGDSQLISQDKPSFSIEKSLHYETLYQTS